MFVIFPGDAIWKDRWKCVHFGFPVSVLGGPGLRGSFGECNATHEIIYPNPWRRRGGRSIGWQLLVDVRSRMRCFFTFINSKRSGREVKEDEEATVLLG